MNCNTCREKLSLYIDKQLSNQEQVEMKAHLDLCEACKKEYRALEQMVTMLNDLPEVEMPDTFHQYLMAKISQEKVLKPIKKKDYLPRYFVGLAASLLVGVVFLSQMGRGDSSSFESKNATTAQESQVFEAPAAAQDSEVLEEATMPKKSSRSQETVERKANDSFSEKENGVMANEIQEVPSDSAGKLESTALDSRMEWQVELTDTTAFLIRLQDYLDTNKWNYQISDHQIQIDNAADFTQLKVYILSQEEVKTLAVLQEEGNGLCLTWTE